MSVTPADHARNVKPADPVVIRVEGGTLDTVEVTGPDGKPVAGTVRQDRFTPEHPLAVSTTYGLTVKVKGRDGRPTEQRTSFRTLAPEKTSKVTVLPLDGRTVGVGQPLSLAFDHPVKDKAAVERRLNVTTDNHTVGSWGWVTDTTTGQQRVDWRPKDYWKPGTKVTLTADLNGVDTGGGRYLTRSYTTSFTIGHSRIAKVDLDNHRLTLVRDGKPTKTVPISGGSPEHATWNGKMTLMAKEGTIRMNSRTVGLGAAYDLIVPRAMRLTTSGTYAHQADWAESYIGKANKSHGCIGLTAKDATWFYDQVQVGDLFEVSGGKETVAAGNGFGEWNLPFEQWQAKSALHRAG
ncbi:Ig-like domain-containing protein [Streptomyces sp. NPDC018045]|uniref:L,D-transpeptidase n=1 Tax=Streptomyces sp. NPDC018045 TaxID=3365037 RepID=UPI00379764B5